MEICLFWLAREVGVCVVAEDDVVEEVKEVKDFEDAAGMLHAGVREYQKTVNTTSY